MNAETFFSGMLHERSSDVGAGKTSGIYSVCCANPIVLEAAMDQARSDGIPLLIEATSNQVNQHGGYTGMKPSDFAAFARDIAGRSGFDPENLILGGDHLGPLVWKNLPEREAMRLAEELVDGYVSAGFSKIHIDTSMKLGDDPGGALPDGTIAARGARLCAAAEAAYRRTLRGVPGASPPVYVIGSEVPAPGGSREEAADAPTPTSPSAFRASYSAFEAAFGERGLGEAFGRAVAFVVQPGIEFNGEKIFDYDRERASELCASLGDVGRPLTFEGHSTDYQTPESLAMMTEDGVGILKVGPGLTFALREGLTALEHIERELAPSSGFTLSEFAETLDRAMRADDSHWKNHYRGDAESLRLQRRYSFFDRARYYLPVPEVSRAVKVLLENLRRTEIPLPLLSQYMPRAYDKARRGILPLPPQPLALLKDRVREALLPYARAGAAAGPMAVGPATGGHERWPA
jgi:D-tagatose-1,6-bisphosphate aldolase subunit GatZ/KbaZ